MAKPTVPAVRGCADADDGVPALPSQPLEWDLGWAIQPACGMLCTCICIIGWWQTAIQAAVTVPHMRSEDGQAPGAAVVTALQRLAHRATIPSRPFF